MRVRLTEYDGTTERGSFGAPDITYEQAVGCFARGATGRVCLVLIEELHDDMILSTLDEVEEWAMSVPGGYLDY